MTAVAPELRSVAGDPDQDQLRAQLWRLPEHTGISSAAIGGGMHPLDWVINIGVKREYRRTDLATHADDVAEQLGLTRAGSALFTAADLARCRSHTESDVRCDATVGIGKPTWAADARDAFTPWQPAVPGTINVIVQLPVELEAGAAVNAIATATEAKSQALFEANVPGTGTASDAIVICWPIGSPAEHFAGPRSRWGAAIARCVHGAVVAGIEVARAR